MIVQFFNQPYLLYDGDYMDITNDWIYTLQRRIGRTWHPAHHAHFPIYIAHLYEKR